eukprot:g63536.t1
MVERNNVDGNVIVRTTCDKASEEIVPEADLKLVHPSFKVGDKVTTSPFMGTSYCVKRLMKLVWKSFPRIRQSLANSNYANLKATVTEVKPPTQEGFSQTCSIEFELLEEKLKDTGLAPKLVNLPAWLLLPSDTQSEESQSATEDSKDNRKKRSRGSPSAKNVKPQKKHKNKGKEDEKSETPDEEALELDQDQGDLPQGLLNKDLIADWPNYKSLSSNLNPEVEGRGATRSYDALVAKLEGKEVDTKSGVQEVGFGCRIFDKNKRELHVLGPCFLYRKGWFCLVRPHDKEVPGLLWHEDVDWGETLDKGRTADEKGKPPQNVDIKVIDVSSKKEKKKNDKEIEGSGIIWR